MSITDEIEEKTGVKIESLKDVEKKYYFDMLVEVQKAQMSPEKIRSYIVEMRDAVEEELCKVGLTQEQDTYLKARLQNYRLLEAFLLSPDRAKQQLEDMVANVTKGIV